MVKQGSNSRVQKLTRGLVAWWPCPCFVLLFSLPLTSALSNLMYQEGKDTRDCPCPIIHYQFLLFRAASTAAQLQKISSWPHPRNSRTRQLRSSASSASCWYCRCAPLIITSGPGPTVHQPPLPRPRPVMVPGRTSRAPSLRRARPGN
ncbi:hypothetical protein F5B22DRAFT_132703 [Xylaria bambusicola]|uniref:uncharacterized protein n=1 Tax=Xylaria bambusicola TaxID=326684 RepID=UPI00200790CB|nr:uncharacterized protein F5B22DRAFT_132703 [Xylaria bambusicola]KAI0517182.1 hypothetical protein F5B22DRAFT_132703 [Xylaria bambusicola]